MQVFKFKKWLYENNNNHLLFLIYQYLNSEDIFEDSETSLNI